MVCKHHNFLIRLLDQDCLQNVTSSFRLAYLHAPPPSIVVGALSVARSPSTSLYTLTAKKALSSSTPEDLLSVLDRVSPNLKERIIDADAQAVLSEESILHRILNSVAEIDQNAYDKYIESSALLSKIIGLAPGEVALIINGRVRNFFVLHHLCCLIAPGQVLGPIERDGFTALDFESLCAYELQRRVTPVINALHEMYQPLDELEK